MDSESHFSPQTTKQEENRNGQYMPTVGSSADNKPSQSVDFEVAAARGKVENNGEQVLQCNNRQSEKKFVGCKTESKHAYSGQFNTPESELSGKTSNVLIRAPKRSYPRYWDIDDNNQRRQQAMCFTPTTTLKCQGGKFHFVENTPEFWTSGDIHAIGDNFMVKRHKAGLQDHPFGEDYKPVHSEI